MGQDQSNMNQDEQRRLQLQARLRELAPKAWFKRPPDNKMTYPCFIYRPSKPDVIHANNRMYRMVPCWNVIYISSEPNVAIARNMLESFPYCSLDREYESDNLYHYSFTLYF